MNLKKSLLSVPEVVSILNVSRRTVYYWIQKGILLPVRIGGTIRFHPEDILALVEKDREGAPPRKKRVLAIDDDFLIRESLKNLLERNGFEAVVVASGEEALELLSKDAFDLILTDVRMPRMNGLETLKAIRNLRSQFGKPPLPEIILTAYEDPQVIQEAKALGVREFILKPFEVENFVNTLQRNLN
ncbi:MAG: response regulator [Candidatus Omnitrophica bacterium]|nr:response regulator [Candidatus Omnitrophota bacterium]